MILLLCRLDQDRAGAFSCDAGLRERVRLRHVRVARDYGIYDRRESPQFYPDVVPR